MQSVLRSNLISDSKFGTAKNFIKSVGVPTVWHPISTWECLKLGELAFPAMDGLSLVAYFVWDWSGA